MSLIREHTEALRPPRALWVPFMLGRPFGAPNDPAFQRKVLLAVLALLEREHGPVLEDFPEDAPFDDLGPEPQGLACPVSFPNVGDRGTLAEQLRAEVEQLNAWHEVAVQRRARTSLGVTGLAPSELAAFVGAHTAGDTPPPFRAGLSAGGALKLACDELKTFYYEAKSAQPGRHASAAMNSWFWFDTAAGRALLAIRDRARASGDPALQAIAASGLVPRAIDVALKNPH